MKHELFTTLEPTRQERKQQVRNILARPENERLCEALKEYLDERRVK
ncbi:hypothetical protein [Sphingobium sp. CCH11-B1]|nr:hypothetical protein [Sphingobium sp. CCH11-B1]